MHRGQSRSCAARVVLGTFVSHCANSRGGVFRWLVSREQRPNALNGLTRLRPGAWTTRFAQALGSQLGEYSAPGNLALARFAVQAFKQLSIQGDQDFGQWDQLL